MIGSIYNMDSVYEWMPISSEKRKRIEMNEEKVSNKNKVKNKSRTLQRQRVKAAHIVLIACVGNGMNIKENHWFRCSLCLHEYL